MGVNSSSTFQVCSSIDIEEHRGPCRCKCMIKSCHYNKVFDRDSCQCMCKDSFAILKSDCLTKGGGRQTNFWDEDTCSCKCKPRRCVKGHYQGIICSKLILLITSKKYSFCNIHKYIYVHFFFKIKRLVNVSRFYLHAQPWEQLEEYLGTLVTII